MENNISDAATLLFAFPLLFRRCRIPVRDNPLGTSLVLPMHAHQRDGDRVDERS